MRKVILLVIAVAALAVPGVATATPGGAEVVSQDSCESTWFGTVCTTVHATTTTTTTPSGSLVYVTNGTSERRLTFSFGGSFTSTTAIHLVSLQKGDETHTTSQRLTESTSYRSGTYALDCVGGFSLHYANGSAQFSDYAYECTTP